MDPKEVIVIFLITNINILMWKGSKTKVDLIYSLFATMVFIAFHIATALIKIRD